MQEGIYRISGKQSTVQQLVHQIELNEKSFQFDTREEVSTVAGLLKVRFDIHCSLVATS